MLLAVSQQKLTYIGNIHHADFQPNLEGSGKLVDERLSDKEHFFRKGHSIYRDLDIGAQYKHCYLDIRCRAHILLF